MRCWYWVVFLSVCSAVNGSAIPEYQITEIDETRVTFSNGAVFSVLYNKSILQEWNINDPVQFAGPYVGTLQSGKSQIIDGKLVVYSYVLLINQLHPGSVVTLLLQQPPDYPAPNTYVVSSIDLANRRIVLSDATEWVYSNTDDSHAKDWEVNDLIMIGSNNALPSSERDAVLYNATKQNVIQTVQQ